jgi:3alpha(or 20beta)-hydroxysteroid dehydrogenase
VAAGPLAGTLAVVAGASRGIGAAIAAILWADGATVVRAARSLRSCREDRRIDVGADLSEDHGVATLATAVATLGVPDVVVSNVGLFRLAHLPAETTDQLDRLYRANLRAPFAIAKAFLPAMRERGRGRHVLIGSLADHLSLPGNAAYGSTKFAARGLHQVLRAEYRGTGVLCSLVSPGPVDTEAWDRVEPGRWDAVPERARMLAPDDIAGVVRWIVLQPPRVDIGWIQLGPS